MKKSLIAVAMMAITLTSVQAQEKTVAQNTTKFSFGVDGGIPVGIQSSAYNAILGASFEAEYPASAELGITGNVGFQAWFMDKKLFPNGESYKIIPLLVGIRYYFQQLYLSGQLGASFSTSSGGKTSFIYLPKLGYKSGKFDINAGLQGMSHSSNTLLAIMLRIAYGLN